MIVGRIRNLLQYSAILLCFTFINKTSIAQRQQISFKHLSTVDGLSNFTVLSITQDKQGFMWFGTMDGLNRFDGKQIRTYRHSHTGMYSLGNNFVHSLLCTSDSGLWVGTGQGLYYYDYHHDDFHPVPILNDHGDFMEDLEIKTMIHDDDFIWIGTSHGLFKYDLMNASIISYFSEAQSILTETVESLHQSDDGTIWIGGKQGLMFIRDDKLLRVENDADKKYTDETVVISINSDTKGNIWFGTLDRETGLIIYNPENQTFKDLNASDGYLPHNKVNCLYRFDDGKIWSGTTWGLSIIDQADYTSQILMYERQNPKSISHNSIRDIFRGEDGIIWIGTYSGGINYVDTRSQFIRHTSNIYQNEYSLSFNIVSSIYEDGNQNLWIGTEYGGLNVLSKKDKTFTVLRRNSSPNSLKSNNVKSTIEDKKGRLFIATQFGISIYNPESGSFFNIDDTGGPRGKLNSYGVKDLCKDGDGNIWIGTHKWIGTSKIPGPGYLLKYDVILDSIIHYMPDNKDLSIIDGGVNTLVYDQKSDIIWSGGDNGLVAFDVNKNLYLTDKNLLNSIADLSDVNDLYLDKNGLLWIATFGAGLQILDVQTYQLRRISNHEGINESSIYAIIGDDIGNIWTSTSANLLKVKAPVSFSDSVRKVERYGIQEGFPPQQFYRGAACKGSDGTLFFGGDDGYISFNPAEVVNIIFHPNVTILDVLVNGKSLELLSDIEDQYLNVSSLSRVPLTHDQSSFAVQFIAPNFISPENTWYQYQLSEIHQEWQDLGTSNTINFTELKAGRYTLKLRASSDPQHFINEFSAIQITVNPPYWASPWAYLVYLIMILVLLYFFFSIARKWEGLNQNLKFEHLQREQEKEFNQRRLKFFTDVSHELRTPLTLILAPLERIVQSNFGNAKIKNQLMLMLRNGDRMLQLINQLLDLRKLETGHMQVKVAKGNIVRFIKEVSLSFRELAQSRNIDFTVRSSDEKINLWFDRDKFEIILFNLLSNALKFTPDKGKISILIENELIDGSARDGISIFIENSGGGISTDQKEHVFERFYSGSTANEPQKVGSGVGLEIVKNLVDLHKGTISVESRTDENGMDGYSRFRIELKAGKGHFSKTELMKNYKSSEDIQNYKRPVDLNITDVVDTTQEIKTEEKEGQGTVLIIEDNPEVRALVVSVFADDFHIFEGENGKVGLDIASEHIPDLIISDIMMPEIDGIELCRLVKTNVQTSHIPVILLTARTAVTFKYEGLETGADDYIVKPFNVEDLRLRAINLIKQRKKLKERFSQSGLILPKEISLTSVDDKLLQDTVDYVIENIESTTLTVDIIAKNIGMSRTNFYRKVKALTGLSASEFLRKIRMDRAAQLLKTNKIRVSEVRFLVGISDADYFRECFKKQFGITPSEYITSE